MDHEKNEMTEAWLKSRSGSWSNGTRNCGVCLNNSPTSRLIQKHLIDGERHTLIVVSTQENAEQAKEIDDHVAPLFSDLGVRLVRPHDADAFANEVEESFRQARSSPLAG